MANWYKITEIENIPSMGARTIEFGEIEIDIFRTKDDKIFALDHNGPHEKCWLSEGIVHEHLVSCTTLNIDVDLETGVTMAEGYPNTKTYNTKIEKGLVYLNL